MAQPTAASLLPRYIILKANYNSLYLRYDNENAEQCPDSLQFSGPNTEMNPEVKFEVEAAETDPNLIHIRSCYNNKYLVATLQQCDANINWITASAKKREEDKSELVCSLFEPVFVDQPSKTTLRLRHVGTGHYVCPSREPSPCNGCLYAGSSCQDGDRDDVYTVIDWESIVILPRHAVFRLEKFYIQSFNNLLLFAECSVDSESVGHEIIPGADGVVRIRTENTGGYWIRRNDDCIVVASGKTSLNDLEMVFQPIKICGNMIILRNLGNNKFCKRNAFNFLSASACGDINSCEDDDARFIVEQRVRNRTIQNVQFRKGDARIYGERPITVVTGEAINRSEGENTIEFTFKYTDIQIRSWTASASFSLGVSTTMSASIPLIVDGVVEISLQTSASSEWEATIETRNVVEYTQSVTIPAMTGMKMVLVGKQAYCDVPFAYDQQDLLPDGTNPTITLTDGVYTGLNTYSLSCTATGYPLPPE